MYTKKKKVEIFVIFLLIFFAIILFTYLVAKEQTTQFYHARHYHPSWIIPLHWLLPIWTVLYTLMAYASTLIWTKPPSQIRSFAIGALVFQVFLCALWPICFFYINIGILTPILIMILFFALLVLMFYSLLVSRLVTLLLIPYLLMIVYKVIFHWTFYVLNLKPA